MEYRTQGMNTRQGVGDWFAQRRESRRHKWRTFARAITREQAQAICRDDDMQRRHTDRVRQGHGL